MDISKAERIGKYSRIKSKMAIEALEKALETLGIFHYNIDNNTVLRFTFPQMASDLCVVKRLNCCIYGYPALDNVIFEGIVNTKMKEVPSILKWYLNKRNLFFHNKIHPKISYTIYTDKNSGDNIVKLVGKEFIERDTACSAMHLIQSISMEINHSATNIFDLINGYISKDIADNILCEYALYKKEIESFNKRGDK